MKYRQVRMTEEDFQEFMAWKNRPRCPNEGSLCNCTGARQPKPESTTWTPLNPIENHTLGLRLGDGA